MAPERVERRLAAILAADVVGYSRLVGMDEEGTIARLRTLREELIDPGIAQHQGRIVKTTGDGVLAEFPSVVDAVRSAAAVQRGLAEREADVPEDRRIAIRVGINLGDIVIDGDDILGDGVNVAARLEGLAESGGIRVSGTVMEHVAGKLNLGFEDMGEQRVKNIEKPVRVYRVLLEPDAVGMILSEKPRRPKTWQWASAVTAVIAIAVTALWWQPWIERVTPASVERMAFPLPDKPSIAVLPFTNLSDDPAQEYFVDGMIEDLITDLSRVSGLFVIAGNSTFVYKGRSVTVRQVAEDLGVRYVLEGSVRRGGNQVRINAQLIDATTGGHVWAERFDHKLEDIFTLQDEVTQKIVQALSVKLNPTEAQRRSRKTKIHPQAYDLFLRGLVQLRRHTPESNAEARQFFHEATKVDPRFARAIAAIGYSHMLDFTLGGKVDREKTLSLAERYATVALKIDDSVPAVYFALSAVYQRLNRFEQAVDAARRTVEIDPNYADGYLRLSGALNRAGQLEESLKMIQMAMRLDPQRSFSYLNGLGRAYFFLGRYEEAATVLEEASEKNPSFVGIHRWLAASYAHLGKQDEAEWEVSEILNIHPDFSLRKAREIYGFRRKEDTERFIEGLRKAGVPE